jgi:putative ATP-dependent endonuclease of OLD family
MDEIQKAPIAEAVEEAPQAQAVPAKAKKKASSQNAETDKYDLGTPKLKKLVIRNFRCIGSTPVEVDLNEIVVLVGPNNSGKSTILDAYKLVMMHGSGEGKIKETDFPRKIMNNPEIVPTIEVHTYIGADAVKPPAEEWVHIDPENKRRFVKELWTYHSTEKDPQKQGMKNGYTEWADTAPWGFANVANANRPTAHRVSAFDTPEEQSSQIAKLVKQLLSEKVTSLLNEDEDKKSDYDAAKKLLSKLQKEIHAAVQKDIEVIEKELTGHVSAVFEGYTVQIDAKPESVGAPALFGADPEMTVGPKGDYSSTLDRQGSGARRTIMWAALKLLKDRGFGKKQAAASLSHVLLLDEPEICLHPTAIREACKVLYDLAEKNSNWQVMVTTHSPVFIDLSRDNTTVVRVSRDGSGVVSGTTIFRPESAKLTNEDKQWLKVLNMFDPFVAEFFFGGRSIIVEGDTEFSAFRKIIALNKEFSDVQVIRARGKYTIVTLMKILNQFGKQYAVLHDCDDPDGKAWPANEQILAQSKVAPSAKIRVIASVPNFEEGILKTTATKEKPYHAVTAMEKDDVCSKRVEQLLKALLDHDLKTPEGSIAWSSADDLKAAYHGV